MKSNSEIIIYRSSAGNIKIDVRLENETVWLTQKLMAELFQTTVPNINMHLKSIYEEGELAEGATIKDFLIAQFRIWATKRLKEYKETGLGYEFATAALHNSHYFCKSDNVIKDKGKVTAEFEKLIKRLLGSGRVKDWFRAYFNYGLINYIRGNKRLLPCEMGRDGFFLDPWGDVLPCNGMDEKKPMGNLKEQTWDEIWNSPGAKEVKRMVRDCPKNCWMIGSVAPAIWHHPVKPVLWVLGKKLWLKLQISKKIKKN